MRRIGRSPRPITEISHLDRCYITSSLLGPATNTQGYIKDTSVLIDPGPGQVPNARNQFGPDSANECKEARSRTQAGYTMILLNECSEFNELDQGTRLTPR